MLGCKSLYSQLLDAVHPASSRLRMQVLNTRKTGGVGVMIYMEEEE